MEKLGRSLEALLDKAAAQPRVLVLLDFDGTLVPIRSRPDLARVSAAQRATLSRLNAGRLRLAMLSGRSVADLRARVNLPDIIYGGVFGLEMREPGWHFIQPSARGFRRQLSATARRLRRLFDGFPGALVEDKGVGVCLHYRNVAPEHRDAFDRRVARARVRCPAGLRWRHGQRSWEVTPLVPWNKGRAALLLWRRLGRPFLLAFGDDRFDEPMFRIAQGRGAALRVGQGHTTARHRLADPAQVFLFLRRLVQRAGGAERPWLREPPVRPVRASRIGEESGSRLAAWDRGGNGSSTRGASRAARPSRARRGGRPSDPSTPPWSAGGRAPSSRRRA
jgi:trehalose 6-phosphate phosphatase